MRRILPALFVIALLLGPAAAGAADPIIIDHTTTDLSQIPDYWIAQARALTFHYAHTSHGSQIDDGLRWLETRDAKYGVEIRFGTTPGLPAGTNVLRMWDGQPGDTYVTPGLYWASADGINRTRTVANTGDYGFSMWSWCGEQSWNSTDTVNAYLAQMSAFEGQYPGMRFILMTGHTDGGSATLAANNARVRQYAQSNDMVVYDFADIESYDPAGNYYPNTTDACSWCSDWCSAHPADCVSLPSGCAHSHGFNCVQKGKAFWWMMARLAGWPGPNGQPAAPSVIKRVVPARARSGVPVNYSVTIRQPFPSAAVVRLTDLVPTGLSYTPGTLHATSGSVSAAGAPSLTWNGVLSPTPVVTVTYAAVVTAGSPQVLRGTAVVSDGVSSVQATASLWANPYERFSPLIVENQR